MSTDVFQFMVIRSPKSNDRKKVLSNYIRDNYKLRYETEVKIVDRYLDARDGNSPYGDQIPPSAIGRLLFQKVFCEPSDNRPEETNDEIIQAVLNLATTGSTINCELAETLITIQDLETSPYLQMEGQYRLLPQNLEAVIGNAPLINKIRLLLEDHLEVFNKDELIKSIEIILQKDVISYVFSGSGYSNEYAHARADLFDALYALYILRRRVPVNLEYIIAGLQVLNVLEWFAIDVFKRDPLLVTDQPLHDVMQMVSKGLPHVPQFISSAADLRMYFEALPVIHPIFARLAWYKEPFNDIKPIGIGDLKVVKQKLLEYLPGDISHIHNVMKGEVKERSHRNLSKTDEVFSFSSEQSSEAQKDTQTTDRFELKREANSVIKSDLQVNAGANVTYNGGTIVAGITAGMSYQTSSENSEKVASNFARDVIEKAVSKVQSKAAEQRSITKTFEIEEINKHSITNTLADAKHVSGIYRWVDKKYKSQVYNYGKRMMFEFVIPEPAAFYVQSKLKAYEMFQLESPEKPVLTPLKIVDVGFEPEQIDPAKYNQLRKEYDLSDIPMPVAQKLIVLTEEITGETNFWGNKAGAIADPERLFIKTHRCKVEEEDVNYTISGIYLNGEVAFHREDYKDDLTHPAYPVSKNYFDVFINGKLAYSYAEVPTRFAPVPPGFVVTPITPNPNLEGFMRPATRYFFDNQRTHQNPRINIDSETVSVTVEVQDGKWYNIFLVAELSLNAASLSAWQYKVYEKIRSIKLEQAQEEYEQNLITFNSEMAEYRNKLAQLKSQTINELIQGKSEAYNREIIRTELKKHCITLLAKEFDSNSDTELLSNYAAIEDQAIWLKYQKFDVTELIDATTGKEIVDCGFVEKDKVVNYPKININSARRKARYIQFLEQAFEWQQIAYIFYPYFWAMETKWIEMMNREDFTDYNMSAFLKAGSVRVLLAVQPSYNEAVLHFLATREPWEGGQVPVIGDPLFLPLFEEIHKQQDDLEGATPEGKPWDFVVPTSLVYLQDSSSPLPTFTS
ncbi:hypothetical protein GZH53_19380 [Flavihumibacter sp. R14]|nr:hypothetical protein [Flavihumibacter soli]